MGTYLLRHSGLLDSMYWSGFGGTALLEAQNLLRNSAYLLTANGVVIGRMSWDFMLIGVVAASLSWSTVSESFRHLLFVRHPLFVKDGWIVDV